MSICLTIHIPACMLGVMKNQDQEPEQTGLPPHEQDALTFRLTVRRLREEREWTQNQLATELRKRGLEEFSQVAVARLERGERAVKLGEARVFAAVFSTTVEDMLTPEVSLTRGVQRAYKKVLDVRRNAEELSKNTWRFENSKISFLASLEELVKLAQAENNPTPEELRTIELIVGKAVAGVGLVDFVGKSYVDASSLDIVSASVATLARGHKSSQDFLEETRSNLDICLNEIRGYLSSFGESTLPSVGRESGRG